MGRSQPIRLQKLLASTLPFEDGTGIRIAVWPRGRAVTAVLRVTTV